MGSRALGGDLTAVYSTGLLCLSNPQTWTLPADEQSLQDIEKAHIARVLESTNWHRGRTCKILGVSRPRLRRLMSRYGLESPRHNIRELDDWNGV